MKSVKSDCLQHLFFSCNLGYITRRKTKHNTTQYMLDTTIRKNNTNNVNKT
jgi:hypothetical protein